MRKKFIVTILFLLLTILVVRSQRLLNNKHKEYVTHVIDGDTIQTRSGKKIRYIGIDTPETYPQTECYGKKATKKNKDLVLHKNIIVERDTKEYDKYKRHLYYVYTKDGIMVNKLLVEQGYAKAKTYRPNTKYQYKLNKASKSAKKYNRGIWKECKY